MCSCVYRCKGVTRVNRSVSLSLLCCALLGLPAFILANPEPSFAQRVCHALGGYTSVGSNTMLFSLSYVLHAACLLNPTHWVATHEWALTQCCFLCHIYLSCCMSSEPNVKTGCSAAAVFSVTYIFHAVPVF